MIRICSPGEACTAVFFLALVLVILAAAPQAMQGQLAAAPDHCCVCNDDFCLEKQSAEDCPSTCSEGHGGLACSFDGGGSGCPVSCTAAGSCAGECTTGDDCDDGNDCTDDVCNSGVCENPDKSLGADCGDPTETQCDHADTCDGAGNCQDNYEANGEPCPDDGNVCTDDQCDGSGTCTHPANNASCDDGLFCNGDDNCIDGSCVSSGNPCPQSPAQSEPLAVVGTCANSSTCNEDNDDCVAPSGTPCDDGQFCTSTDQCDGAGTCVGSGSPCSGECNATCTEATQSCFDGSGTPCTPDGNPCTDDVCDGSGTCGVPNTASCDDGNACTTSDACSGGSCVGGAALTCNDGIDCTDDSCNPASGCVYTPNDGYCDDLNVCTTDYCGVPDCAGAEGAELVACNTVGGCVHDNNTESCDDGDPCTEGDSCSEGTCQAGTPKNCSDGIACTADTCDGSGNCQNTPNDALCDDKNVCTTDVCDPNSDCVNRFVDSDGDAICDPEDPHPSEFDPTGCLYDEATGRVIPGGLVTPSGGPGTVNIGLTGASGCYQFSVTGLPDDPNSALFTLSITLPPNCVRSTSCLADPNALDPTGGLEPYVLGPYNVGGYINPHDCGSNPLYLSFDLSAGDPTVLNNNIPLECEFVAPPAPAPALSPWGIVIAVLLLLGSAFVALRVRRNER